MSERLMIEIWSASYDATENLSDILKGCPSLEGVTIEFERGYHDSSDRVGIWRPETDEEMAERIAEREAREARREKEALASAARALKAKEARDKREFARLKAKFEGQ